MRVLSFFFVNLIAFSPFPASAAAVYWNLFNLEDESSASAVLATYGSLNDMLTATNELATYTPLGSGPVAASNLVGSGSDGTAFWNLFNKEGESSLSAAFATYATLEDMLTATNDSASYVPLGAGLAASQNVVGSGSDGSTYWNLFNKESESSLPTVFATYATLKDMLTATNELATHTPLGAGPVASSNLVGTGSDGTTYWNLFNMEGESSLPATFATYSTLEDMLNDTNRLGVFSPTGAGPVAARNVIGTGAFFVTDPIAPVPVPASGLLLLLASAVSAGWWRRSQRRLQKTI